MTDGCEIETVTGSTTDPESGEVTDTVEQVYAGRCRVQQATTTAGETNVGEAELLMLSRVLQLPVATSPGVRAGHRVRITACANDPDLVGRLFVVRTEFAKSHATSRRLGIQEATS
ncbi:hypothetical protein GA0074694_3117 [Micromonospora inyonensis]|uniref:Uncharacterized protein n=2 Tax=Micromonospora inyonensis TaxID=47866 RepID=A0A1C6RXE2_9ACTN|nr:hypothetical protein GA0074694_3117 [Micromonospora inyonensis]